MADRQPAPIDPNDTRSNTLAFMQAQAANVSARGKPAGKPMPVSDADATGVFGDNGGALFPPGTPLEPTEPQLPRYVDFPVNVNRNVVPRAAEAFGFPTLRAFANIEVVRLAIETRKEQIEALEWSIELRDPKKGEKTEPPERGKITEFMTRPDGVNNFATWTRMLLEDMLVCDAATIERQRSRAGDLVALLLVPGDTIKPLLDQTGRRPTGADVPAYQQWIRGKVWCNLSAEDLIYMPRNPRPGKVYGFGPVEQVIVTAQTLLARQTGQLGYFTDGNIPAGILTGPEGWTPQQLREMQDSFDVLLKGDANHRSNLIWTPYGTKYQAFKDPPLKTDFDEWLARIVQYAFNLPPTAYIRAMNRGTASNDSERGAEEGLMPIKLWLKRLIDRIIQVDLKAPDLEWKWADKTEVQADAQAKVDDLYLRNGSITINEVRDRRGLPPVVDGDTLLLYSPTGVLPLETAVKPPPDPVAAPGPVGGAGATGPMGPKSPVAPKSPASPQSAKPPVSATGQKVAKAGKTKLAPVSASRPKARRHKAEIRAAAAAVLTRVGDHAAAELERRLRALHKAGVIASLPGVQPGDDYQLEALNEGPETDDETKARKQAHLLAELMTLSDLLALTATIQPPLLDLAQDASTQAIASTGADITPEVEATVASQAQEYADARAAGIVSPDDDTGIVSSTRDMVEDVIFNGLMAGNDASTIADAVQAAYAFSPDRADAIAETETQAANAAGAEAGYGAAIPFLEALGISLTKGWATQGDDLVEDICLGNEAAGELPFSESFPSGDTWVPAHNRCRCDIDVFTTI